MSPLLMLRPPSLVPFCYSPQKGQVDTRKIDLHFAASQSGSLLPSGAAQAATRHLPFKCKQYGP